MKLAEAQLKIADLERRIAGYEIALRQLRLDVDYAVSLASTTNGSLNQLRAERHRDREKAMRGIRQ